MPCTPAQLRAAKNFRVNHLEFTRNESKINLYKRRENPEYLEKYRADDRNRKKLKREFLAFLLILIDY
jgi:hypothetical protein